MGLQLLCVTLRVSALHDSEFNCCSEHPGRNQETNLTLPDLCRHHTPPFALTIWDTAAPTTLADVSRWI